MCKTGIKFLFNVFFSFRSSNFEVKYDLDVFHVFFSPSISPFHLMVCEWWMGSVCQCESPLLECVIYYPEWVVIKSQHPQLGLAPRWGTGSLSEQTALTSSSDMTDPTPVRLASVSHPRKTLSLQTLESTRWQNLSRNSLCDFTLRIIANDNTSLQCHAVLWLFLRPGERLHND